jgi:hypothetical protein
MTLFAKEIDSILRIPDQVFTEGVLLSLPTIRFNSDNALLSELTMEELHNRTQPSCLGRNDQTVLDLSLRKSRETRDITVVEFGEAESVLASIATAFNLPVECLDVHASKLVVYAPGSFFLRHQDAEHRAGHFLSLVVCVASDAVGGDVVFSSAPRLASASAVLGSWKSAALSWAAWFASTHHSVEPVESGHRVVVTFDVTMVVPPVVAGSMPRLCPLVPHGGQSPFPQLVWEVVADLLELSELACLASTSRALHRMFGGVPRLLAVLLKRLDVSSLAARGLCSIGFVARHPYLLNDSDIDDDGEWRTERPVDVNPLLLKGRDRLLCEAMRLSGRKIRVQRAVLVDEVADFAPRYGGATIARVRVASEVLSSFAFMHFHRDDGQLDSSAFRSAMSRTDANISRVQLDDKQERQLSASLFEFDNWPLPVCAVPFAGVLFLETIDSLRSAASFCCVSEIGTTDRLELWGNQAHFGFKSYRNVVMIADVIDPLPDNLCFGDDFT